MTIVGGSEINTAASSDVIGRDKNTAFNFNNLTRNLVGEYY